MLRQLLVSVAVSACDIAIHAIVMAAVLWAAHIRGRACNVASIASTDGRHNCDRIGLLWPRILPKWSFGHLLT
jgi:hypothetical protein